MKRWGDEGERKAVWREQKFADGTWTKIVDGVSVDWELWRLTGLDIEKWMKRGRCVNVL